MSKTSVLESEANNLLFCVSGKEGFVLHCTVRVEIILLRQFSKTPLFSVCFSRELCT